MRYNIARIVRWWLPINFMKQESSAISSKRTTGDKLLPESMMAQLTEAYMHQYVFIIENVLHVNASVPSVYITWCYCRLIITLPFQIRYCLHFLGIRPFYGGSPIQGIPGLVITVSVENLCNATWTTDMLNIRRYRLPARIMVTCYLEGHKIWK